MKEKTIAKVATESLGLGKDNYERLKHYKNPSFQHTGVGIGDFSLCFEDVVKPYLKA